MPEKQQPKKPPRPEKETGIVRRPTLPETVGGKGSIGAPMPPRSHRGKKTKVQPPGKPLKTKAPEKGAA